jgi:hypothetical protein
MYTNQIFEQSIVENEEEEEEENNGENNNTPQSGAGEEEEEDEDENIEEETMVRRSTRPTQPSTRLRDYVTHKVRYPIENFISYKNISKEHHAFLSSISKMEEPRNFE